MSSFSMNAAVSIQILQPYSNIWMSATLWILKFSLFFGDFNINLTLANAEHASPNRA